MQPPLLDVFTIDRPDQLKALGHPLRLRVLEMLGQSEEAVAELKAALELRADYAGAWLNYGFVLRRLGRLDEAEDALRRASELAPAEPSRTGLSRNASVCTLEVSVMP